MKSSRGFTLIEMVAAISLLAVVSVLMTQVFSSSMKAIREATERQDTAWRYDHVVAALQRDAQSALTLTVRNSQVLELDCGGGDRRQWVISSDSLTRKAISGVNTWKKIPGEITFNQRGSSVLVHVPAAAGDVVLASPGMLVGGTSK